MKYFFAFFDKLLKHIYVNNHSIWLLSKNFSKDKFLYSETKWKFLMNLFIFITSNTIKGKCFGYRFIFIICQASSIWTWSIKILLICSQLWCLLLLQNFIQTWLSVVHIQAKLCCGITVAIKELQCKELHCQLLHTQ